MIKRNQLKTLYISAITVFILFVLLETDKIVLSIGGHSYGWLALVSLLLMALAIRMHVTLNAPQKEQSTAKQKSPVIMTAGFLVVVGIFGVILISPVVLLSLGSSSFGDIGLLFGVASLVAMMTRHNTLAVVLFLLFGAILLMSSIPEVI